MVGSDADKRQHQDGGFEARSDPLGDGQGGDSIGSEREVGAVLLDAAHDDKGRAALAEEASRSGLGHVVQVQGTVHGGRVGRRLQSIAC
jgi:hypothetical protein